MEDLTSAVRDCTEKGMTVSKAVEVYNIPASTLRDHLYPKKQKTNLRKTKKLDSKIKSSRCKDKVNETMQSKITASPTQKWNKSTYRQYSYENLSMAFNEVVKDGLSVSKAARKHAVPESTLRDRLKCQSCLTEDVRPGPQRLLTDEQEAYLVKHVLMMAAVGNFHNINDLMNSTVYVYAQKSCANFAFSFA